MIREKETVSTEIYPDDLPKLEAIAKRKGLMNKHGRPSRRDAIKYMIEQEEARNV